MTSYMYNPSKKVTEILSKYLEFDPEQLQLGIWSGDLSLSNVNLRADALYPLINRKKASQHGKEALKLKLVKGTIGNLRIVIPWKSLVWGQGSVQIEIKGLKLVVAFESHEESALRKKDDKAEKKKDDKKKDDKEVVISNAFRAAKQKMIKEAEQRLMKGQPLASWLASMRKKQEKKQSMKELSKKTDEKIVKGFQKWIQSSSSSFIWRFLSGLTASIEGLKLVVVQDGIEVGLSVPEIAVSNKSDAIAQQIRTSNVIQEEDGEEGSRSAGSRKSDGTPPANLMYESQYDDGEHVDKTIKLTGVSVFARRAVGDGNATDTYALLPDDYILRPVDTGFAFSFFYPYPEEQRKNKTRTPGRSFSDAPTVGGDASTLTSSKRRRGKRDRIKRSSSIDGTASTDLVSSFAPDSGSGPLQRNSLQGQKENQPNRPLQQRPGMPRRGSIMPSTTQRSGTASRRMTSSVRSSPLVRPDDLSSVYASAMAENKQLTARFDAQINFGEIKFACSTDHFQMINQFLAAGHKMRNGRPMGNIADLLSKTEKGRRSGHESLILPCDNVSTDGGAHPPLQRTKTIDSNVSDMRGDYDRRLGYNYRKEQGRTKRAAAVKAWWQYAYDVVTYELRKRKKRRDNFRERFVSFDWSRQTTKRAEYVALYINMYLDNPVDAESAVKSPQEDELLRIEDELPVEQILLYRSTARSLRVRGFTKMPESLLILYQDYASRFASDRRRASVVGSSGHNSAARVNRRLSMDYTQLSKPTSATDENEPTNFLSMIGNRCDQARKYRSSMEKENVEYFVEREKQQKTKSVSSSIEQENTPGRRVARVNSMGFGSTSDKPQGLGESRASIGFADDVNKKEMGYSRRGRGGDKDVKTVRTMKTTKSAIAGSVVDSMTAAGGASVQAAKVSCTIFFKSIELMLVEAEPNLASAGRPGYKVNEAASNSGSSDEVSELSFRSEEDFFREQEDATVQSGVEEEEMDANPIMSSTDFLLFGLPKNTLLHLTLAPIRCTVLGRSGGSKNINFTIGSATASGCGHDDLLAIGSESSSTPVPVVSLNRRDRNSRGMDSALHAGFALSAGPKDALSFSVVMHEGHNVLQADISKIHASLDAQVVRKLLGFKNSSTALFPKKVLPKSLNEEARMFILRENTGSNLAGFNSSVRFHGIDVSVPVGTDEQSDPPSSSSYSSGSEHSPKHALAAKLTTEIIEVYSGTAVDDLCGEEAGNQTGSLGMLDVAELVALRGNLSSQHCVVAISGIDCALQTETDAYAFSEPPRLLGDPIDVELLWTGNTSTILDEESPKQEIVVEVSPIHVLLSEMRLLFASRVLDRFKSKPSPEHSSVDSLPLEMDDLQEDEMLVPPRLEALSRLIMTSIDVSFKNLRLSLMEDEQKQPLTPGQKEIIMKECIGDFLAVASCFDLSFPNEDALSTAMQICIDRLVGLGHFPDDAWDCANSALLSFLEDEVHEKEMAGPNELDRDHSASQHSGSNRQEDENSDTGKVEEPVDAALNNAVAKAIMDFPPPADEVDPEMQPLNFILVVDLPGGAHVSAIRLFYDSHLEASVPTLFVTNTAGIHLVRIVPAENDDIERRSMEDDSASERSEGESNLSGLVFSTFLVDENCSFGKGGLPLSVLGSDEGTKDGLLRHRERMDEIQIGEFEFAYSLLVIDDVSEAINKLKGSLRKAGGDDGGRAISETKKKKQKPPVKSSLVATCESVSLLLTSDELVPFCRIRLGNLFLSKGGTRTIELLPHVPVIKIVSRTFTILNLTREGQFYPEFLSVMDPGSTKFFPVQIKFAKHFPPRQIGSELTIEFRGVRLFVVRQFINELLQYLTSGLYGLGKMLKKPKPTEPPSSSEVHTQNQPEAPKTAWKILLLDSSLVIPRSSSSHDLASIEVTRGVVFKSQPPSTFRMPTATSDFEACPKPAPDAPPTDPVNRFNIQLHKSRLFTALGEDSTCHDMVESPVFRYFYDLNGRAECDAWVYCKHSETTNDPPAELEDSFNKICDRRWKEITSDFLSLEVLVDYAPHMRCLIAEPLQPEDFIKAPRLDVRLSQFCMLLSIWYCNMQELPVTFPYFSDRVMRDGRDLKHGTVPKEYGTDDYLSVWEGVIAPKSEICVMLKNLSLKCTFDEPGYFSVQPDVVPQYASAENGGAQSSVFITFTDAVVQTYSDLRGMMRVGVGASGFELFDERRSRHCQRTFTVTRTNAEDLTRKYGTWVDINWGLDYDLRKIDQGLPQPVQISVFMTKDWCLINLGLDAANAVLIELSPIWFFLGFFVSYYQHPAYGNPNFIGQENARKLKRVLSPAPPVDPDGLNIDFRLWLSKPHLVLPCDLIQPRAPSLRIEGSAGFWYRFKKIKMFKSQEIIATSLDLLFANEFLAPRQTFDDPDRIVRHIVEGLSFCLRIDKNCDMNGVAFHADYALQIPFNRDMDSNCSITAPEIQVAPVILESPTICTPVENPTRYLGPNVCEITVLIEVLPLTSSTLVNFFTGPVDENAVMVENPPASMSFSAAIGDLRLFAVDPVLGVQLPVAVVSIASITVSASQLSPDPVNEEISRREAPPEDLQVALHCHLWADYFKLGVSRSWEPLLEPYYFALLYEQSRYRGKGMSLNADCPLHLNISGALLLIIDEVVDSFSRVAKEAFGGQDPEQEGESAMQKQESEEIRDRMTLEDRITLYGDETIMVMHEIPKPLSGDRVAFSLSNLTGQKMRLHQQVDVSRGEGKLTPAIVTYLNHGESTSLSFDATISVVKNLSVVEVPYPGLPHSKSMSRSKQSTKHSVDIQMPGFRWLQGIKVDTFGRKFENLKPRSEDIVTKVKRDWRLENIMRLLIEVGLDNGGRLVTIRSLFEVRNKTSMPFSLVMHPDPKHTPYFARTSMGKKIDRSKKQNDTVGDTTNGTVRRGRVDDVATVQPGEFYQIPALLLETSLRMGGSHLGSIWMRPNEHTDIAMHTLLTGGGHDDPTDTNFSTHFCSRPVQLAKLVDESARMFEDNGYNDMAPDKAKSGLQIACPVKTESGETLAPFCYAIEVGRSPIVRPKRKEHPRGRHSRPSSSEYPKIHGPIAYTISVHAPFVIVNLLPETGRFELMHAVRRTVLWYGDLKPGQQVPVHSVGLDAPLLLLLNLGFCRTPVGEGALVHHGPDTATGSKDNLGLKSLVGKTTGAVGKVVTAGTKGAAKVAVKGTVGAAKVVTKGTKQIGKTLTSALSDSPEKRSVQSPQPSELESRQDRSPVEAGTMGLDADALDGKVHTVEGNIYSPEDVAVETAVVDSIGQRLTLSIENTRGGGGQRRIAVYCPFWIVNTTEHSLRYKQENSKSFVCGTVVDAQRDGSKPVDGSTRNYVNSHRLAAERRLFKHLRSRRPMHEGTIFAGTSGALATSPGRCDLPASELAELIDKDLPVEKLASLGFMFNFHEDVLSLGTRKLSIQLADGAGDVQYFSDWSRGFSLDSVGFSQIVALHCREGRALELSVVVGMAPGFLSGYTKIVRIVPRYVLVNQLEFPVRLWQDSSVFRPLAENTASSRIDELVRGTESRNWRFRKEGEEHHDVINSYESLWGRVTTLEERDSDRMPEGTTAHRSASYITTAGSREFVPFHLPDSRGERQLRIGLGGTWNLTASFASDFPGDHSLNVTKAVDLRFVKHVSTRASPQYKVLLPPNETSGEEEWDGELGVWFETDWGGDSRIIVKGTKRGRFGFNETDIHAGDELLRIDNVAVSKMTFSETMKLLKHRIAEVSSVANRQRAKESTRWEMTSRRLLLRRPNGEADSSMNTDSTPDRLVLTFRTLEERLRRLRMKAALKSGMNLGAKNGTSGGAVDSSVQEESEVKRALGGIRVEMKPLHHSMFVVLRKADPDNPPFRIENRSLNHSIFYRQRGCEGHAWSYLKPGQTQAYSWEEPMRAKRLSVRAARDSIFLSRNDMDALDEYSHDSFSGGFSDSGYREVEKKAARSARLRQILSYQYVDDEEQGHFGSATTVKLEEIGFRGMLACPSNRQEGQPSRRKAYLNVEVETDGATRILVVSDETHKEDEKNVMNNRLEALKRQIRDEEVRSANLSALKYLLMQSPGSSSVLPGAAESNISLYSRQLENKQGMERYRVIEDISRTLTDDFPEESSICRRHQIVVEVLEAIGLNPENEIGACNPYCEVALKGRSKLRKSFLQKRRDRCKTYYVKKSLSPKWTDQAFVFEVPEEAVSVTRGHSIHVTLRNFRLVGAHRLLGQAIVHLHSVRNQQELVGWYPLAGRTGRRELENPLSSWGRGSVKLRIQWVYTVRALMDYFIMFTERRLLQLQERRHGLKEQWKHATTDSDKRKKEKDPLKAAIVQAMPKSQRDRSSRKISERDVDGRDGTLSRGLTALMDPLKMARDKARWVSVFQRNKKNSDVEAGEKMISDEHWGHGTSAKTLPRITEDGDSSSSKSDRTPEKRSFERRPPPNGVLGRGRGGPLDRSNSYRGSARVNGRVGGRMGKMESRHTLQSALGRTGQLFKQFRSNRALSQRSINIKGDDLTAGSSEHERGHNKYSDLDTIKELLRLGLVFHQVGKYFYRSHVPYHFYGLGFDGSTSDVRNLKSWTSISNILNDESFDVNMLDSACQIQLKTPVSRQRDSAGDVSGSISKRIAREKLELPWGAPPSMARRSLQAVEWIVHSRNQFERACRRALRSVLNPGGWLTIRPVTALNLPDTYNGMHVKLRYGPEVVVSSTVDAKVTPTWTPKDVMNRMNMAPEQEFEVDEYEEVPAALNMDSFEFYENDLLFYVEPQKTSGSIRLSVVGERLNNKSELGVLHIPLGAAIGSCIDCIEDYLDSFSEMRGAGATPMYIRWFPLMSPKDTEPVEGDMGLSSRPLESEKLGDDMFHQYFAPCIQLALMWWPDDREMDFELSEEETEHQDGSVSFAPAQGLAPEKHSALTNNYFNADIGRISAALIDSDRACELVSFSALDIDVRYSVTDAKTRMGLVIGWIQLDHQEDRSRDPVVLAPKPVEHIQPTFQLVVVKDNLRSKKNIVSYEHIRLTLEEMDLTVEEAWLFDLWDFFIGVVRRREVRQKANRSYETDKRGDDMLTWESRFLTIEPLESEGPNLMTLLVGESAEEGQTAGKVYVEQLVLGLFKVNLSYVKGKKQSWELTDKGDWVLKDTTGHSGSSPGSDGGDPSEMFLRWSEHTYDEDIWAENQGKRNQNLKGLIGAVLPTVSDAPIRLQGKVLDNVFESPSEILSSISKFYVMETLRQVYKIIGSLDFVGNPTMIFSSFVSGVRDLVVTPSMVFLRSPTNPTAVASAVGKGTLSLFSHSTSGIFGFIAKTSATAGQFGAMLSLDGEYREWHRDRVVREATNLNREWKKRGAQSLSAVLTRPIADVLLGVAMGATGVVMSPYKGLRDGGNIGFAKGVAVGGIGVVVKPLVGLLDGLAHFSVSVHDIARSVNILERRFQPVLKLRLPYIFGLNNVLTPFDSVWSRSVYLLKIFPPKGTRKGLSTSRVWKETHIASEVLHMEPGVDTYSVVTSIRIVLIRVKRDSAGILVPSLCWEVSLVGEDTVSSQVADHGHNGVALTVTKRINPAVSDAKSSNKSSRWLGGESDSLQDDRHFELETGSTSAVPDPEGTSGRMVSEKSGAYHSYGATLGKSGETLEWYTVLAEYPNRPQLTRMHNAISCVVGDFDAVIEDQGLSAGSNYEGVTTFGLFEFDKNQVEEADNSSAEMVLLSALDRLPWMHEGVFEDTKDHDTEEKKEAVKQIREKAVFSAELRSSIVVGGPAWMIEARAHAMFVAAEALSIPSIPKDDVVARDILYQQQQGNISLEQVRILLECHEENLKRQALEPSQSRDINSSPTKRRVSVETRRLSSMSLDASDRSHGQENEEEADAVDDDNDTNGSGGDDEDEEEDKSDDDRDLESNDEDVDSSPKRHLKWKPRSRKRDKSKKRKKRPKLPASFSELSNFEQFQSAFGDISTTVVRPGDGYLPSVPDLDHFGDLHAFSKFESTRVQPLGILPPLGSFESDEEEDDEVESDSGSSGGSSTEMGRRSRHRPDEERIERMEALMEQLVILNSQVALINTPALAANQLKAGGAGTGSSPDELGSDLRDEIVALRAQLVTQTTREVQSHDVLAGLREELKTIRVELTKHTDSSPKSNGKALGFGKLFKGLGFDSSKKKEPGEEIATVLSPPVSLASEPDVGTVKRASILKPTRLSFQVPPKKSVTIMDEDRQYPDDEQEPFM